MYNGCSHLHSTATGKPSSFRRNAWAPASWCTRWLPPCVTRSTFMASGPLAGTRTQARSCRTTTTTRRAPSSPPNGRSPISCQQSSDSSTRCIQRGCWSSPSPTALRPAAAASSANFSPRPLSASRWPSTQDEACEPRQLIKQGVFSFLQEGRIWLKRWLQQDRRAALFFIMSWPWISPQCFFLSHISK